MTGLPPNVALTEYDITSRMFIYFLYLDGAIVYVGQTVSADTKGECRELRARIERELRRRAARWS